MMEKAGAGWLRSIVGMVLIAVCWTCGELDVRAQEEAAPAPSVTETAPVPTPSFSEANVEASARLEAVRGKTLPELKELLEQTELALPELMKASSAKNVELRNARTAANREAPEIKELYKQIEDLQVKIAAVTDTLPAVREKLDAYNEAHSDLFEEMQFRTKLMGLISSREASEPTEEKKAELP